MPLYQYFCKHCGIEFDLFRPMAESGLNGTCLKCGGDAKRMISKCFCKPFPGTYSYDRRNGFVGGMSSGDFKGYAQDQKDRPRIDNLGPNKDRG